MAATRVEVFPYKMTVHSGRVKDFRYSHRFSHEDKRRDKREVDGENGTERALEETIENGRESCTDLSGSSRGWTRFEGEKAVEVSPLRKYPILPARQKRLRRITAMGMAWFILRGNFIAVRFAGMIPHSWDHENAILIMWPIRGHRVALRRRLPVPPDHRVDERWLKAVPSQLSPIILHAVLCYWQIIEVKVISVCYQDFRYYLIPADEIIFFFENIDKLQVRETYIVNVILIFYPSVYVVQMKNW